MKIAYIKSPSQGVHYHRLETPMGLLAEGGMNITETQLIDVADCPYDVVIFNRLAHQPLSNFQKLKDKGVKIIVDLDDYWTRPVGHSRRIEAYESLYTLSIIKALRLADVVWVSTPHLQKLCAEMQIKTYLVPNAIDYTDPQFKRQEIKRTDLYAGWCGRNDHHLDWMTAAMGLKADTGLNFKLGGVDDFQLTQDKRAEQYWGFIAKCISGGRTERVTLYKATDAYNYATFYNEIDIVLLPSHNTDYALCKSNLKLLESAAHGLPVISNGGCYREVNGKIGIRVEHQRDWVKGLKKLKESKRARAEYGLALSEWAKSKYDILKINEIRKQTIEL